jgi:hypothetical protein
MDIRFIFIVDRLVDTSVKNKSGRGHINSIDGPIVASLIL